MIRMKQPPADAERSVQKFDRATDHEYRDRVRIILVAHRGRQYQEIAADLGRTGGPSGPGQLDSRRTGRPPKECQGHSCPPVGDAAVL
jgi:hypothetical protein